VSHGTVKMFNTSRGFGFVQPDDGAKDVFVHVTAIERSGIDELRVGDRVSFESEAGRDGRMQAVNLKMVKRAPQGERDCGNTFVS
jgi:cold shock protein